MPRLAAVGGAIDAALIAWSERMPEHGSEHAVRIAGIDGKGRNLLRVVEAKVSPRLAGIEGFVNAVADGKVGTGKAFAAGDINDVRI